MNRSGLVWGIILMLLAGAHDASAALITVSLPEFSGEFHDENESYPLDPVEIGTFTYEIPAGDTVQEASLTGQFGNAQGGNTALMTVLLDDLLVAQCLGGGCDDLPQESISFNFSKIELKYVEQKQNTLRVVQTGPGTIRLGQATLRIATTPVPEPATVFLMGVGLLGVLGLTRRRSTSHRRDHCI